jgi:hypothetical protein
VNIRETEKSLNGTKRSKKIYLKKAAKTSTSPQPISARHRIPTNVWRLGHLRFIALQFIDISVKFGAIRNKKLLEILVRTFKQFIYGFLGSKTRIYEKKTDFTPILRVLDRESSRLFVQTLCRRQVLLKGRRLVRTSVKENSKNLNVDKPVECLDNILRSFRRKDGFPMKVNRVKLGM